MHAACLVILPKEAKGEETKWVDELMAPYSEQTEPFDRDDAWWDWWRVGGRWDGYFLGLEGLSEDLHYTDAVERLDRNSAPANVAGEWDTFTVVSVEGYRHKNYYNPEWIDSGYSNDYEAELRTPDYAQWRAEQLVKYRDGVVVVVDYHS